MDDSMTTQPQGVSRRTVMKGAAWSVPVIAVAAAAPAMAASPGFVEFTGDACKWPGNSNPNYPKAYEYEILSTNSYGEDVIIAITGFSVDGVDAIYVDVTPEGSVCGTECAAAEAAAITDRNSDPATLCVPSGASLTWLATAGEFDNSGNPVNVGATIYYSVYDSSCNLIESDSRTVYSTPPNC